MDCKYQVRRDTVLDDEDKERVVYGIDVVDGSGQIIKSVSDVFSNCEAAERFVQLFNEKRLSTSHLDDVVLDLVAYL